MGGMPGGMPNMPPGLMADPEFMQIMSDPQMQELMPVFMQAQSNPAILQQYANRPIVQRLMGLLQRHGVGGGMGGGMGGWGSSPAAAAPAEQKNYVAISSKVQLDKYLSAPNVVTVIYFTMQGCGPCARIAPIYDNLALINKGKANFCKVQAASRDLTLAYDVKAFPTFVFIFNRKEVERIRGADNRKLENAINFWIGKAAAANVPKARFVHFPVNPSNLPCFRKANFKRMKSKIVETNKGLAGAQGHCDDAELSTLLRLCSKLDSNQAMAKQFDPREYALVEKLLGWGIPNCLPAVELFGALILQGEAARHYSTDQGKSVLQTVIKFCSSSNIAAKFLASRALINMFNSQVILSAFGESLSDVMDGTAPLRDTQEHKLAQKVRKCYINILTIFSNFFRAAGSDLDFSELKVQMLSTLNEVLLEEKDTEVLYSSLVCIGTLLMDDEEAVGFTEMFELGSVLTQVKGRCNSTDKVSVAIRAACDELTQLLKEGK